MTEAIHFQRFLLFFFQGVSLIPPCFFVLYCNCCCRFRANRRKGKPGTILFLYYFSFHPLWWMTKHNAVHCLPFRPVIASFCRIQRRGGKKMSFYATNLERIDEAKGPHASKAERTSLRRENAVVPVTTTHHHHPCTHSRRHYVLVFMGVG